MNNTSQCPSCSSAIDITKNAVCPSCGFQLCTGLVPVIVQPVRRVQKLPASVLLALLIDITGSTGRFSEGVFQAVKMILDFHAPKIREMRVFLHTAGDLDYGQECTLVGNGVTAPEATTAVERLSFGGGGDEPETHLDSVQTVLNTTPWELDRHWRNVLILFLTADSKPARSAVTARQLGEALRGRGIQLYVVAEDYPFARELSEAACGLFFSITNDPEPAQMQQIAVGISQTLLLTVASPATKPMTVPMNRP